MKIFVTRILLVLQVFQVCAVASNSVVNLSHYDLMRVDFERMKSEGIAGVIHEATYPRFDRDSYYGSRQDAATRAGLLWGAYHFGDATDPVRQADHFLDMLPVSSNSKERPAHGCTRASDAPTISDGIATRFAAFDKAG